MYPIPMRHGLTIGEIARLFNEQFGIGADLEVIAMDGWRREMYCGRHRSHMDHLVAEHPDVRHDDGVSRRACCSKARTCRKAEARRGRSS